MLEEFHAASALLSSALERYLNAYSALHNGCSHKKAINSSTELSDFVKKELDLVKARIGKLTQAEVAIKRVMNNLASVPVNALPPEVLAHIFHLVLIQQPCPLRAPYYWNSESLVRLPKYPDTFSHVCSWWRQIALASHELWSHIDIPLLCSLSKQFHNRAAAYVSRAHRAPLDIHFLDPGCTRQAERPAMHHGGSESSDSEDYPNYYSDGWNTTVYVNQPKEFTFLASSARPRIRSLGLLAHGEYNPIHNKALEYCLFNTIPSGLLPLVTNVLNGELSDSSLFGTSLDPQHPKYISSTHFSDLSEQQLESAWRSTTTLFLSGGHSRWNRTAYQGLMELRLHGGSRISGSELARVLSSSPGLRILYCDFNIDDLLPLSTLSIPVVLRELETLSLKGMDQASIQRFLRWLKPGLKPLRLTLCSYPTSALIGDFFMRSNVQEICVIETHRISGEQPLPPNMFFLPSQLKTLNMINCGRVVLNRIRARSTPPGLLNEAPEIKLDTMYMVCCRYDSFTQFHDAVAKYAPRRLIIWECNIGSSYSRSSKIDMPFLESKLGDGLSRFCPSIECLTSQDLVPLQDWD